MNFSPRRKKPKETTRQLTRLEAELALKSFKCTPSNVFTFSRNAENLKFKLDKSKLLDFDLRPLSNLKVQKVCDSINEVLFSCKRGCYLKLTFSVILLGLSLTILFGSFLLTCLFFHKILEFKLKEMQLFLIDMGSLMGVSLGCFLLHMHDK